MFAVILLTGCGSEEPVPNVELSETPVLTGRGSWALVTIEYARLYERPDTGSPIATHGRRGEVLAVDDGTPDRLWYLVRRDESGGWARSTEVRLFPTREQALNARGLLDSR